MRSVPFGCQGIACCAAIHLDHPRTPTRARVGFCLAEVGLRATQRLITGLRLDGVYSGRMNSEAVVTLALRLQDTPWRVVDVWFDAELRRLDFLPGSGFPHPESGQDCPVYDTEQRS